MNVLEILKLGSIGLFFLFSYLTFRLLSAEQKKEHPHPNMIKAIYVFMVLCVVFGAAGIFVDPRQHIFETGYSKVTIDKFDQNHGVPFFRSIYIKNAPNGLSIEAAYVLVFMANPLVRRELIRIEDVSYNMGFHPEVVNLAIKELLETNFVYGVSDGNSDDYIGFRIDTRGINYLHKNGLIE